MGCIVYWKMQGKKASKFGGSYIDTIPPEATKIKEQNLGSQRSKEVESDQYLWPQSQRREKKENA